MAKLNCTNRYHSQKDAPDLPARLMLVGVISALADELEIGNPIVVRHHLWYLGPPGNAGHLKWPALPARRAFLSLAAGPNTKTKFCNVQVPTTLPHGKHWTGYAYNEDHCEEDFFLHLAAFNNLGKPPCIIVYQAQARGCDTSCMRWRIFQSLFKPPLQ